MQRITLRRLFLTAAIVICATLSSFSQDNDIKGFVYEESTGEPVMFSNVFLKGTTLGCSTNENGYFNITRIPDGKYTLYITCVGFDTLTDHISLSHGQTINKKYTLKVSSLGSWSSRMPALFRRLAARVPISIKHTYLSVRPV